MSADSTGEPKAEIESKFEHFILNFKDESGKPKYREAVYLMPDKCETSLVIDFADLYSYDPDLGRATIDRPAELIPAYERVVKQLLSRVDLEYAEQTRIHVKFKNVPNKKKLGEIRSRDIYKLVSIEGVVVKTTPPTSVIDKAAYVCVPDGHLNLVDQERIDITIERPTQCEYCNSRVLKFDPTQSIYIDHQRIVVQEKPEDLPPGQLPRSTVVELLDDLVGTVVPGDRVTITGIVKVRAIARNSKYFRTYIEANHIEKPEEKYAPVKLTKEDIEAFHRMAEDPWIHRKIVNSIAPSIYGYEHIKEAIAYMLFGGVTKELPDMRVRGDIHILLVGDPGVGKSQLLRYVSTIAPRGMYTTGKGSTAAGLTAAVIKEKEGNMTLEAGALVLADKGVCCIDEIDKMRNEDRVAIHPAMEQQVVSIAKGGIIATLNARTSILAAANPTLGRYNPYESVTKNINLPVTILSRFDLIFVIRDEPDPEKDEALAEHILRLHQLHAPPQGVPIPPDTLRKYIWYAKQIQPRLTEQAMQRLKEFYLTMRKASQSEGAGIAITPRQLETLIRLAEARARMHLRQQVTTEDVEAVIALMKKSLEQVGIDTETGKIDIDVLMTGKPKSLREKLSTVLDTIIQLDTGEGAKEQDLYEQLQNKGLTHREITELLQILQRDGAIYSPKPGLYKKI